jgi:hypothetical protein
MTETARPVGVERPADPSVVHEVGSAVTVTAHGVELLRYTYQPQLPAFECPSPYFHPLRSLAGDVVTGNRPHDHRWHKGLAMTASHLSGQNFWGGGTYTPGAPGHGYLDLPNVGRLEHRGFAVFAPQGRTEFTEHVDWVTVDGERWIEETRRVAVRDVDAADGSWALEFDTELRNVRGTALEFGSPTVFGRELAGYCGFFWRGPRSFTDGTVIAADGGGGPEMMGRRAGWLAYVGTHDEVDRSATLLFLDAGEPPSWFVRTTPYPVVNPSLAFDTARELPAGQTLRLRYRLVVADTAWDRERLASYVKEHPW